jgi:hypothetical protein
MQSSTLVGQKLMYMDADHSGLNKYSGRDDSNFALLLPELRRMVENSGSVVADRYRSKGKQQLCRRIAGFDQHQLTAWLYRL